MTPIPPKIRKLIDADPFYKNCALYGQHNHVCDGRITMDHSIIYGGKQLQEVWAITPVCAAGHGVDGHKDDATLREMRLWIALNRATQHELIMISKAVNYVKELDRLNKKWGIYSPKVPNPMPDVRKEALEKPEAPTKKMWYTPTVMAIEMIIAIQKVNESQGFKTSYVEVIENAIARDFEEMNNLIDLAKEAVK